MDLQRFKAACARIAAAGEIGTGYLVAPDLVATCHHVVKGVPPGGAISLTFSGDREGRSGAVVAADAASDCALVRLARPATATPLPVGAGCREGEVWQAFGYPAVIGGDGDTFGGTVRDPAGVKAGRAMLELLCTDALAGRSPRLSGLSGAPVLVGDRVVGHVSDVRSQALNPGETIWGRLYAVPASDLSRLPGFPAQASGVVPAPPPPRAADPPSSDAGRRFEALQEAGRSPVETAVLAAHLLLEVGEPAAALERLRDAGDGTRAVQLRALALARTGRKQEAVALLEPLVQAGRVDTETGGLLGGRYKDLWRAQRNPTLLARSFRVYLDTWRATRAIYPGVNALATALWLRHEAPALFTTAYAEALAREAEEIARRCREIPETSSDAWDLATRAELHLLEVERDPAALEAARRFYALAASCFGERYQNLAVVRRQARWHLKYLGRPEAELDLLLPVPGVVAFTGHMTDAPDRAQPRFPPRNVRGVRAAIRAYLKEHRVGFGFSSGARGSDLVFAQEILDRGGRMRVLLPFPAADFKRTSVGFGWNATFDDVLGHPRTSVKVLRPELPPATEQPDAYAGCNLAVRKEAREQAERLDQDPRLLAVWNGRAGDGPGGAADAIAEWNGAGLPEPKVIDPGAVPSIP